MRRPNDLRMSGKSLELVFDELGVEAEKGRPPPPSREAKLRALDRLDFRADTLGRLREIAPLVLAVSTALVVVLAGTRWARHR